MILEWSSARLAAADPQWTWRYFTPKEMRCPATNSLMISTTFMDRLEAIRHEYDKPITILSGYRTPAYNGQVTGSGSMTGAHTLGRAADIYIHARERDIALMLSLAKKHGMTRCGLQLSSTNWKLHFDDMTAEEGFYARGDGELACWTY
jgi:hypothetical protein